MLSAVTMEQWPDESLPEICLAGRSNVGKSTFINTMTNRRHLARTSSTPGKTRTLNFYEINHELRFVDVPGYGYARVSQQTQDAFGPMMESYMSKRKNLKGMILLLDMRRVPSQDDLDMLAYARYYELPVLVICTKEDKCKRSEVAKQLSKIKKKLACDDPVITFSSVKKLHVDAIWDAITQLISL